MNPIADMAADMLETLRDRGWSDVDPIVARLRKYQRTAEDAAESAEGMRYDLALKIRDWPGYSAADHREAIVIGRWCRYLADLRAWEIDRHRSDLRPLPPRFETGNPDELPPSRFQRLISDVYDAYNAERPKLQTLIDACKPAQQNEGDA